MASILAHFACIFRAGAGVECILANIGLKSASACVFFTLLTGELGSGVFPAAPVASSTLGAVGMLGELGLNLQCLVS